MSYTGQCNCGGIRVSLPQQPPNTVVCHWWVGPLRNDDRTWKVGTADDVLSKNCKKAGGAFSVNYLVPESDLTVDDTTNTLKDYHDTETGSGTPLKRRFCSNCGSPVLSASQAMPGYIFLKATLFESVSPVGKEAYTEHKWEL